MHRLINTIHCGAVIVTIAGLAALGLAQTAGAATAAPTTPTASAQSTPAHTVNGLGSAYTPDARVPVVLSSSGMSHAAQTEDPITSKSRSDCTDYLETWGYEVTKKRYLICGLASFPFPSQQVRIATCTAALLATGVGGVVAPISCILATAP
ncbi:hypothetical protein ACIRG5_25810 [Lentzea sp. NPDC102401]|uniref:hypothetical protein n=1 Tax=Lentzea sp. NPDC102401 TaxID=3364128 RepID=UPI00380DD508